MNFYDTGGVIKYMRKNKIQKLSIVALTGLVAVSAYAWLNNSEIQTGTNYIKPGTISIIFDNEANAITLNGSEAIPATNQYALDTYTPYTFKVKNDVTSMQNTILD